VDPVETLMKVQLGGGTDIGRAVRYASTLVENPRRTIVVLISDFFEGADASVLFGACRSLIESGVTLLGLAALDDRAEPNYNRDLAQTLVNMGAHVGAMTPGELAEWVASKVR
jgi:Mg-chelatase subunit ChlD